MSSRFTAMVALFVLREISNPAGAGPASKRPAGTGTAPTRSSFASNFFATSTASTPIW